MSTSVLINKQIYASDGGRAPVWSPNMGMQNIRRLPRIPFLVPQGETVISRLRRAIRLQTRLYGIAMKHFILSTVLTVSLLCSRSFGDVYLHNPRGSNNRLNERSANRKNANRVFDSQVCMPAFEYHGGFSFNISYQNRYRTSVRSVVKLIMFAMQLRTSSYISTVWLRRWKSNTLRNGIG